MKTSRDTGAPDPKAEIVPVSIEEVLRERFPRSLTERFDRALLNLARRSPHLGKRLDFDPDDHPLVFAANSDEALFVFRALEERGWVRTIGGSNGCLAYELTPAGWVHYADITQGLTNRESSQVFVAMWFGNYKDQFQGQTSCQFSMEAYRNGFAVGIQKAGYEARRIDLKEYNDDVTDEIVAEIRRSRFLVADFTRQRNGVYYEAGFAHGLGLPVIFTCHKEEIDKVHFDTNHYNHIVWSLPSELAEKLERRIVATIGQRPPRPSDS